jgi:copper transport protein
VRLLLLLAVWTGVALWAAPAAAHAVLTGTEPADRAILSAAPEAVLLHFNEPVSPVSVQLLDAAGGRVETRATVSDSTLRIALPPGLASGAYIASWRVTSADSHPVAGSLVFAIGAAPASWAAAPAAEDDTMPLLLALARALLSATLLFAAGGVFYDRIVAPAPGLLRPVLTATAAAALLSILVVGLQGAVLSGGPVSSAEAWRVGAASTRGTSALVTLAGLLLLATARRNLALLGALIALSGVAFTGHTGTASPRWAIAPLLVAHVALAAFWLGSLAPLLASLPEPRPLRRFSRIASGAVPLLLLAGLGLALVHLDRLNALIETPYGEMLFRKLVLVALLLGLAALNRLWLTPRLPKSSGFLRATILAEIALGLAILTLTAFLSQTPPPSSPHAHAQHAHLHGIVVPLEARGRTGELEITPAMPGRNLLLLRLDLPAEPKEVTIELSLPGAGIEPLRRTMEADNGAYVLEGPELSVAGTWRLRISVLVDDFEQVALEAEMPIK